MRFVVIQPAEGFADAVQAFAESMLQNSWFSLRANKRLLIETDGMAKRSIWTSGTSGPALITMPEDTVPSGNWCSARAE